MQKAMNEDDKNKKVLELNSDIKLVFFYNVIKSIKKYINVALNNKNVEKLLVLFTFPNFLQNVLIIFCRFFKSTSPESCNIFHKSDYWCDVLNP